MTRRILHVVTNADTTVKRWLPNPEFMNLLVRTVSPDEIDALPASCEQEQ
jgi:hypothetical protein